MLPAQLDSTRIEAGCDEVGRGCLAGPVVAAAVILPPKFEHEDLRDSKQLSARVRNQMTALIQQEAIAWNVSFVDPILIDRYNILNASFLGMERAVKRLSIQPEHLLIDGNRFRSSLEIPFTCIVKGDAKNASIAAASILAKTYRDEYMALLHEEYPAFGWASNVGYPTKQHREAIAKLGPTKHHRKSFNLLPSQLELSFGD